MPRYRPAMKTDELWGCYVEWLRVHVPRAHENLAPPATEAQIESVEQTTGVSLPDAIKRVWRRNDGQRETMIATRKGPAVPCIPTLSFLSTAMVIEAWKQWDDLRKNETAANLASLDQAASSVFPGKVRPQYTNAAWIPVWSDPTRADYVGLDLDPDAQGTRGQIINFGRDEERHAVLAEDLDALLVILLDEVKSGAWVASRMPYGKDASIDWFGDPDGHFFNALQARRPKTDKERANELFGQAKKARVAKHPERALELLAEADALTEMGGAAIALEVDALEDLERWQDADAALARLIERAPKLPQHAVRRAKNLLDRLGDPATAATVAREALKRSAGHADLEKLLARARAAG